MNKKYCINLGLSGKEHGLTYMALSRDKQLIQIAVLSTITGTRIYKLDVNSKTVLRVQHRAELLRMIQSTRERLNKIVENT